MFYSTWGHRGECVHKKYGEVLGDFKSMNKMTTEGYAILATKFSEAVVAVKDKVKIVIAPVGRAFEIIYDQCVSGGSSTSGSPAADPTSLFYRLYQPDNFHPSKLGTYMAACVFYAVLYGKDPRSLEWYPEDALTAFDLGLQEPKRFGPSFKPEVCGAEIAAVLRAAAYTAVFEQKNPPTQPAPQLNMKL